jgi:hypothetical protein
MVMASNYNSRPRVPEVLVDGDRFEVVRERESYEDLIRGESIPRATSEKEESGDRSKDGDVTIAAYRPKAGCEAALLDIVRRHLPALRSQGLITDRPAQHLRAKDGTILEIFEWKPGGAEAAHHNPVVMELWDAIAKVAEFPPTGTVQGMDHPFSHFHPVDLDSHGKAP